MMKALVVTVIGCLFCFTNYVSSEYNCAQVDYCSADGSDCTREYALGRLDFCTTDANHDGVINIHELFAVYKRLIKDGDSCDRDCYLGALTRFPACRWEIEGSYKLLSGYDGDGSSISQTDFDLWYNDLVKYEGRVPVTAHGFRTRFHDVYRIIGDPECSIPYLDFVGNW